MCQHLLGEVLARFTPSGERCWHIMCQHRANVNPHTLGSAAGVAELFEP